MFVNSEARAWTCSSAIDAKIDTFHCNLPGYSQTPLLDCSSISAELSLKNVFLKDESARMGLPAFKILGASWATYKAITKLLQLPTTVNVQTVIKGIAEKHQGLTLFAATEGNHGRAVAKMATLLGIASQIFVPQYLNKSTRDLIEKEGACVVEVLGDYNEAVVRAKDTAHELGIDGLLIQDTAFDGYEDISQWIVDGYSTMMKEADSQIYNITQTRPDVIVVPVGVGSLAQSVVTHYKSQGHPCTIIAVEPEPANCLQMSLKSDTLTSVSTEDTIMCGLNCGTVSSIAWPILQKGVDVSVYVTDAEAHESLVQLKECQAVIGPCAAATLAALKKVVRGPGLDKNAVVLLLGTEGIRDYEVPTY
ncbi:hypothetical protein VE01_08690 [Pseudogymnoascus verrucosus]|uniref:Tryptophan synthase beta chain-like PALP domain-containing protein n=1 Tax=Pseudogymnoascus verrucosus TaxID=342668 RepID=A0A1B8GCB1_9PEZI|nr:uncharacterized protein VE01_08690 [Pseudogymnoascus verrucosus]OBT93485.2 hypothetical protein VE01_08690 [Pseudogymnoascus verrucosus]